MRSAILVDARNRPANLQALWQLLQIDRTQSSIIRKLMHSMPKPCATYLPTPSGGSPVHADEMFCKRVTN